MRGLLSLMPIDAQVMLSLRENSDALRIITDRLRVKEMGPADHIRTKHEVRDFVQSGGLETAQTIIAKASLRRERWKQRAGDSY